MYPSTMPVEMTPIDPAALAEICQMVGDDSYELLVEMIDGYFQEAPPLLQSILRAVHEGDAAGLETAAHTLKSLSTTLGAIRLGQMCQHLETLGYQTALHLAADYLPQLETEFALVVQALEAERCQAQRLSENSQQ